MGQVCLQRRPSLAFLRCLNSAPSLSTSFMQSFRTLLVNTHPQQLQMRLKPLVCHPHKCSLSLSSLLRAVALKVMRMFSLSQWIAGTM